MAGLGSRGPWTAALSEPPLWTEVVVGLPASGFLGGQRVCALESWTQVVPLPLICSVTWDKSPHLLGLVSLSVKQG